MKKIMLGILTIITILAIFSFTKEMKEPVVPDKEWIIAPRFLTLQEGVTKKEAREWLKNEYLLLYREFPGFNAMVGEPLRSGRWGTTNNKVKEKGDFVLVYFFDTKKTKDHYFPEDGSWSNEIEEGITKHQSTFDKLFGKYFVQDKYQNEEYLMFARAK